MSTTPTPTILIADDDPLSVRLLSYILKSNSYRFIVASNGQEAMDAITTQRPDLALLDVYMPKKTGLEVITELRDINNHTPVVFLTASGMMDHAIEAMSKGAYDFLTKPVDRERLLRTVSLCLKMSKPKAEKVVAGTASGYDDIPYQIIGKSELMIDLSKRIGSFSQTPEEISCLIQGESGTGKELVARQIHRWGKNSSAPFIAVNMAAIPRDMLESELFGHEKGAFTGAVERRGGKIEEAGRGTLFLDEIGAIPTEIQAKLLRVLQEREFYAVGGKDLKKVQCRVVSATNEDLAHKIERDEFRADLYYRLKVMNITIPPLRDRKEDIPILVVHFLAKYCRTLGKPVPPISPEVMNYLYSFSWPGNIRELENSIASAVHNNTTGILILSDFSSITVNRRREDLELLNGTLDAGREKVIEDYEYKYISALMEKAKWDKVEAAAKAGVSIQRIYQLLRKYGIQVKKTP